MVRWEATAEEYREDPALNQSGVKYFREAPEKFHKKHVQRIRDDKPPSWQLKWGGDLDNLTFDGRLPAVMIPDSVLSNGARRGARWNEWKAEKLAEGLNEKDLLKADEFQAKVGSLLEAQKNILECPKAKLLLLEGETHSRYRWKDEQSGITCKAEIDCISQVAGGMITDLKSMAETSLAFFQRQVLDRGYHIQAWWYQQAALKAYGEKFPVTFVGVKNSWPHNVEIFELEPEWFELAEVTVRRILARIAACYDSQIWRSHTHNKIRKVPVPPWAWREIENE